MDNEGTSPASEQSLDLSNEGKPVMFAHAERVYGYMDERAENRFEGRLWIGRTVEAFEEAVGTRGPYSMVMNRLQAMGCIERLKRGGGGTGTIWRIVKQPSLTDWELSVNPSSPRKKDHAKVANQVHDLLERVQILETQVSALNVVLTQLGMDFSGHREEPVYGDS